MHHHTLSQASFVTDAQAHTQQAHALDTLTGSWL
jgi:hypothetical protein